MSQSSSLVTHPVALAAAAPHPHAPAQRRPGWLFHPAVDFLCLGGGSLLLMLLLAFVPLAGSEPTVVLAAAIVANFVNHPHFAHSYQIFYRRFGQKAFGADYPWHLRARYVFAGVAVPLALAAFFAAGMLAADASLLAYGLNLMLFLVGWHYVKQGYGMLVLDSVLKRRFFSATEKRILLVNAYGCWIASWTLINVALVKSEMWGLKAYALDIPGPVATIAAASAAATTACLLYMLGRKALVERGRVPVNGILAYAAAVYVWLIVRWIDPIAALIVPAFHSLQYLVVVWRYELNYERARAAPDAPTSRWLARLSPGPFARFVLIGILLGFLGFWGVPLWLEGTVSYDRAALGGTAFLFVFWIFINVHHYCIDNVIWRRDNPDVRTHLFA